MTTSIQKAVANALSFAHLASLGRGKAARASEGDDDKKDDKKDAKAEDEKPSDDDDDKDKKETKAEDDEPDASASADDDDKPDEDNKDDDKKSKSKAKAEDEDDDDEEMRGNSSAARARRREQARCAAIFASPAAAKNPVLAANLAFKSRMGRVEALTLLESTPAAAGSNGYGDRSARNPRVGAGGSSGTMAASSSPSLPGTSRSMRCRSPAAREFWPAPCSA
jgi:hypothetical protein